MALKVSSLLIFLFLVHRSHGDASISVTDLETVDLQRTSDLLDPQTNYTIRETNETTTISVPETTEKGNSSSEEVEDENEKVTVSVSQKFFWRKNFWSERLLFGGVEARFLELFDMIP
jgi:hypothetical protein